MRANKPLLHGDITASIIDSLFEVHKELGFRVSDAQGQLVAGLAATNLEVGLVLHLVKKGALLSRLLRTSVHATKPAVPLVAVAVPFPSTVQLPFPENGASVTSMSLLTLHRRVPQGSDREMCFGMRCGLCRNLSSRSQT